jgi:hypothetical protein
VLFWRTVWVVIAYSSAKLKLEVATCSQLHTRQAAHLWTQSPDRHTWARLCKVYEILASGLMAEHRAGRHKLQLVSDVMQVSSIAPRPSGPTWQLLSGCPPSVQQSDWGVDAMT